MSALHTSPAAPAGPVLPPRFRLVRVLGEGGQGVVSEAIDEERGVRVAVKTLLRTSARAALALREEFRRAAALHHPHLVEIEGLFEHEGAWSIAMELVAGRSWVAHLRGDDDGGEVSQERVRRPRGATESATIGDDDAWSDGRPRAVDGPRAGPAHTASPDAAELRRALEQLVSGVAALHDAGLLHRDLKPSNVLVTPAGRVVVLDYGLARERGDGDGSFAGTPLYAAPEQLAREAVDEATDLYAIGVMLFEALTGRRPFEMEGPIPIATRKRQHDAPRVASLAPDAPADLAALADALLARRPSARPSAAEVLARLGAARTATRDAGRLFVGRRAEVAALEGVAARAAASGGPELGVVIGRSGIGKTALLARVAEERARRGEATFAARCHPHDEAPFRGVRSVLDAASRAAGADLAAALDAHRTDDPDARDRSYAAIAGSLRRLAGATTVAIVIDDLQWIDRDGLDALVGIFTLDVGPVALLVGTRADAEAELGALRRAFPRSVEIELAPLPAEDASLLATRLGRFAEPGPRADEIAAPIVIGELARVAAGASTSVIDGAIVDRAAALPPLARQVLTFLACAGRPVAEPLLADAVGVTVEPLQEALRELRRGGWVRVAWAAGGRAAETTHDRVPEALLARVDADVARATHLALAEALVRSGGEETAPAALVRHLERAGHPERAAAVAVRAATRARRGLAFGEAAELLDRAVRLGPADDALREAHADALARAGRGREAADVLLALAAGAAEPRRSALLQRAAEQLLTSGELTRGLAAIERVLEGVGDTLPRSTAEAALRLGIALARARRARLTERRPHEAEAARLERTFAAFRSVAFGLGMIDNLRAALYHARAFELAHRVGDEVHVGEVLATEAIFRGSTSTAARRDARGLIARARSIAARRGGEPRIDAWADGAEAVLDAFDAPTPRAIEALDAARARFHGGITCAGWARASLYLVRALSRRLAGDFVGVRRDVALGLRDAARRGDRFLEVSLERGACVLDLVDDDVPAAEARLARAAWAAPGGGGHIQEFLGVEARAEIDLYAGAPPAVLARHLAALRAVRRSLVGRLQRVRVLSWSLEGRLLVAALAAGEGGVVARARAHLAARRLEAEDVGYARVKAAAIRAALARERGDRAAARADLERLILLADRDGLRVDAALARLAGAALGAGHAAAAERWLAAESIVDPTRLAAVVLPGLAT